MKHVLFFLLFLTTSLFSLTWDELFEEKKTFLNHSRCIQLQKQLHAFKEGKAPVIAHEVIKAIPIEECNEPLTDIILENHPRIYMDDASGSFAFESKECSQMRKSLFKKLTDMIDYLDAYALAFGYEKGLVNIAVNEGLRSIETQIIYFENRCEAIRKQHPQLPEEQVYEEASTWVSPIKDNIPVHSTGAAIDIQLTYKGSLIDMGSFGVSKGVETAPTFSENITDQQKRNRLMLLLAASQAGLTNYVYEFWHFSYGDRYDVYWKNYAKKVALYSSVALPKA